MAQLPAAPKGVTSLVAFFIDTTHFDESVNAVDASVAEAPIPASAVNFLLLLKGAWHRKRPYLKQQWFVVWPLGLRLCIRLLLPVRLGCACPRDVRVHGKRGIR